MSDSALIEQQAEMLPFVAAKQMAVAAFERDYLSRALTLANGSVTDAARMTGLDRANLRKLLIRNGLRTPGRNTREFAKKDLSKGVIQLTEGQWRRLDIVDRIERGEMTIAEGAAALGISPRQMKRIRKLNRSLTLSLLPSSAAQRPRRKVRKR